MTYIERGWKYFVRPHMDKHAEDNPYVRDVLYNFGHIAPFPLRPEGDGSDPTFPRDGSEWSKQLRWLAFNDPRIRRGLSQASWSNNPTNMAYLIDFMNRTGYPTSTLGNNRYVQPQKGKGGFITWNGRSEEGLMHEVGHDKDRASGYKGYLRKRQDMSPSDIINMENRAWDAAGVPGSSQRRIMALKTYSPNIDDILSGMTYLNDEFIKKRQIDKIDDIVKKYQQSSKVPIIYDLHTLLNGVSDNSGIEHVMYNDKALQMGEYSRSSIDAGINDRLRLYRDYKLKGIPYSSVTNKLDAAQWEDLARRNGLLK